MPYLLVPTALLGYAEWAGHLTHLLLLIAVSCAALTRTHTLIVLAPAFVFLLDGIAPGEIRSSFRRFPARFPGGVRLVIENGCAFLAHWLLVIPLTLPWMALRFRGRPPKYLLAGLLAHRRFRSAWAPASSPAASAICPGCPATRFEVGRVE